MSIKVPVIQNIHQAVYKAAKPRGKLDMNLWHCGTAHSRAGWVVTLAGPEGEVLERKVGTAHAAELIYGASSPIDVPFDNFFSDKSTALADMKRCAEEEAALNAAKTA